MVEISFVMVCRERRVSWPVDADQPDCNDSSHTHIEHEVHRHRTPVRLPDGSKVVAVSFDAADPYGRDPSPDFGLYLDARWSPPWPHDLVDWPDFGLPRASAELRMKLETLLQRARSGERVELGCLGGHGRTGTALSCLAVLAGVPAGEAVTWTRRTYCDKAVETPEQAAFVVAFGD